VADTFVDTDEEGPIATKQEQLTKVAHSKAEIKSLDVDQERVDWYGDMAVVTERFKVTYLLDGKEQTEPAAPRRCGLNKRAMEMRRNPLQQAARA
jgi:hypothetical protein